MRPADNDIRARARIYVGPININRRREPLLCEYYSVYECIFVSDDVCARGLIQFETAARQECRKNFIRLRAYIIIRWEYFHTPYVYRGILYARSRAYYNNIKKKESVRLLLLL